MVEGNHVQVCAELSESTDGLHVAEERGEVDGGERIAFGVHHLVHVRAGKLCSEPHEHGIAPAGEVVEEGEGDEKELLAGKPSVQVMAEVSGRGVGCARYLLVRVRKRMHRVEGAEERLLTSQTIKGRGYHGEWRFESKM